jgi:hypothetical protein
LPRAAANLIPAALLRHLVQDVKAANERTSPGEPVKTMARDSFRSN